MSSAVQLHTERYTGHGILAQISLADSLKPKWVDASLVMVRFPYGAWNANVAERLNSDLTASLSHIGTIGWNIDLVGGLAGMTAPLKECAASYLQVIEGKRKGICS
jgi:hypothetical protein